MAQIYKFTVRLDHAYDPSLAGLREQFGLRDLQRWRDFYIETSTPLSDDQLESLRSSLGNDITEKVELGQTLESGRQVQVAYRRSIVDNENDSIVDLCRLLDIPATAGKVATTFASDGSGLASLVEQHCCNASIEEVHTTEPNYETLQPAGFYEPMRTFDLRELSDEKLTELGQAEGRNLNLRQMRHIRTIQQKTGADHVTDVLLEALDARWSDHCSHTTWKSLGNLLKKLIDAAKRTDNPNIVSMFHDNAGVWDFYDDWCIAFKAETHNGPSAISAYFGQLTKLGGVLRDVLGTGLGADPIGVFEYTATGEIGTPSPQPGRPAPKQIAIETIRAIKEYGNTFGTPMMQSHMTQHPAYRAKPFALGGCIGLIPKKYAQRGTPIPGDMLMLIGGLTGNDGIHGATASSAGNQMDTASVQIGSPLEEIKFRQAIIELRDADCLRAITDLGAAGLNSAVGEIGEACGVWMNTALVPLKTEGLAMWRILLSESQERMLMAVIPEKLDEARVILKRHRVRGTVVGRFAETGRYTVVHDPSVSEGAVVEFDASSLPLSGEVGLDVPYALLKDETEARTPEPPLRVEKKTEWPVVARNELKALLTKILSDPEVADQTYAGFQYDSTVQGHAAYGPYVDRHSVTIRSGNHSATTTNGTSESVLASSRHGVSRYIPTSYTALSPVYGKPYATVFSTAFNPWLFEAHPRLAARQTFLQTLATQVLAGVKLADICLCDNFYTPHLEPGADHWLVEMVNELAELVDTFGTPLISGKDSSAGSVQTSEGLISVPPAVYISALGKVADAAKLLPNQWQSPGNVLYRIGPRCESAAGTVAARALQIEANDVDRLSATEHREFLTALQATRATSQYITSGVPIGSGGTLATVLRGILASGWGVELDEPSSCNVSELLMEHRCGAIVEVPADLVEELDNLLADVELQGLPDEYPIVQLGFERVGTIVDQRQALTLSGDNILTDDAITAWRNNFQASLQ